MWPLIDYSDASHLRFNARGRYCAAGRSSEACGQRCCTATSDEAETRELGESAEGKEGQESEVAR